MYLALFVGVVVTHGAITNALREAGWAGGTALIISGAIVLGGVMVALQGAEIVFAFRAKSREQKRLELGLPAGPCCVVWRAAGAGASAGTAGGEADMPWTLVGAMRAPYPPLARRLGIEGVALLEFEVNAEGAAKNIHCLDAWPSNIFYEASLRALKEARFTPKPGVSPRFGASYRMPFVFRIAGASRLADRGRAALPHRPALRAAQLVVGNAVEKLRRRA